MFPLSSPPTILPRSATVKLWEKPTTSKESIVPKHPRSRTGFRPIRSERVPHHILVKDSAKEKEAMRMPQ